MKSAMERCCDLLSKMYLCRIGNNMSDQEKKHLRVVICFQKCIFVVLETTNVMENLEKDLL